MTRVQPRPSTPPEPLPKVQHARICGGSADRPPTVLDGKRRSEPLGTQRPPRAMPPHRHTCIPWRGRARCATSSAPLHTLPGPPNCHETTTQSSPSTSDAAAKRATPVVRDVLIRYPPSPPGRARVAVLMRRLDGLLREPPPVLRVVGDTGPFFHGTRADLTPGGLLAPGRLTNYGTGKKSRHVYLTATGEGASLAAALAHGGGPPRVYRVEPLGPIHDDPNVTDKKFPGNPTRSYRTTEPLRVLEEIHGLDPPPAHVVAKIRANTAELAELGIEAID